MKLFLNKKTFSVLENFFALIGLLYICVAVAAGYKFATMHTVSTKLILSKTFEKAGFEKQWAVVESYLFKEKYSQYQFQGSFKSAGPRILFKSPAEIEVIRNRYNTDSAYRKVTDSYAKGAAAWFCKKDLDQGRSAVKSLLKASMDVSKGQNDSNIVSLPLQYDLLFDYPGWTPENRHLMQVKFKGYLRQVLKQLNEDSASLWHGRFQLACSAWITASVIEVESKDDFYLVSKAQAHFIDAIDAIRITEGWPGGYNYWINNRAYPFALACLAHMSCVDAPLINEKIKVALETSGMWTIYGTRPDGRFALFGDAGPRNDLKDETQRFIDLVFLGTRKPVFEYYSAYLSTLHKNAAYYSAYRWGIPVFRGLSQLSFSQGFAVNDLSFAKGVLPNSRIFGPKAFDQVFINSSWDPDATFISFRAGDTFAHHGHYQAGHFTLFKYAALGLTSGTYGEYTSSHRLNYYIRTVASNSILIQQSGELIHPNHFFKDNVSAGGQKIIIPTGSAITSVENYKENRNIYQGATITAFDNDDSRFVYINSDLTRAYSKDKAEMVTRELCYLFREDLLVVHDTVQSVKKEYTKKWLFHTWNKPVTDSETVLVGDSDNGILLSSDNHIDISHQDGTARIAVLMPIIPVIRKIGGKDFRYYVETDGDDSTLNGVNMSQRINEKPWFDSGMWRIEIQSPQQNKLDEFLVVIQPGKVSSPEKTKYKPVAASGINGIETSSCLYLFPESGQTSLLVEVPSGKACVFFGLPKNKIASIIINQKRMEIPINKHGVMRINNMPVNAGAREAIEIKI